MNVREEILKNLNSFGSMSYYQIVDFLHPELTLEIQDALRELVKEGKLLAKDNRSYELVKDEGKDN